MIRAWWLRLYWRARGFVHRRRALQLAYAIDSTNHKAGEYRKLALIFDSDARMLSAQRAMTLALAKRADTLACSHGVARHGTALHR